MDRKVLLGIALIIIGIIGIITVSIIQFRPTGYTGLIQRTPFPTTQAPGQYEVEALVPKNIDEAEELAESYVASLGYSDLAVEEIMEFEYNYYIIFYEKSTGIGAFETLIWKTGQNAGWIMSEPGPNIMWNTKYGHMMGYMGQGMMGRGMIGSQYKYSPTADMPIDENEAQEIGREYLNQCFPGTTIEESTKFYGYYTFDFGKEGLIEGMFSVNGYTGQTWYHGWHGDFIQMKESH